MVKNSKQVLQTGSRDTQSLRLSDVDKRSLVYARLPAEAKGTILTKPEDICDIPYHTTVWIEHILKNGETDWPWFAAVLEFLQSPLYQETQKTILAEIARERERWHAKVQRPSVRSSSPVSRAKLRGTEERMNSTKARKDLSRSRNPTPVPARPHFWDSVDPSWWREQP